MAQKLTGWANDGAVWHRIDEQGTTGCGAKINAVITAREINIEGGAVACPDCHKAWRRQQGSTVGDA